MAGIGDWSEARLLQFIQSSLTTQVASNAQIAANQRVQLPYTDKTGQVPAGVNRSTVVWLPAGAAGQVLTSDTTPREGMSWQSVGGALVPAYTTVQSAGTPITQRNTLNFTGSGLTAADSGGVSTITVWDRQPYAQVSNSTTQTIGGAGVGVILNNDTETLDNDSMHDNVTNNSRITCPHAGMYAVYSQVAWQSSAAGYRIIDLFKNGAQTLRSQQGAPVAATHNQSAAFLISVAANEYLEISVAQNSGGNLTAQSINFTACRISQTGTALT